ncbi:hypothetical protein JCM8547_004897 [Rhodosporidiobolus lusitaniae]
MPILCSELDVDALRARRERAIANPLEAGAVLSPSAPSLDTFSHTPSPGNVFSRNEQQVADDSPNPLRPPIERLRDVCSSQSGFSSLSFRLLEPFGDAAPDRWAHVWRVEVTEGEEVLGIVVLKLLVEALFRLTDDTSGYWQPAEEGVKAELAAYKAFRAVQGRDVPHLYGAFSFRMPWSEQVVGFVLEDLSPAAENIYNYLEDRKEAGDLETVEQIDGITSASNHLVHRLQRLGITSFEASPGDVQVFSSSSHPPQVAWLDFGQTQPASVFAARHAEMHGKLVEEGGSGLPAWQHMDEYHLGSVFRFFSPVTYSAWVRMEMERKEGCLYLGRPGP